MATTQEDVRIAECALKGVSKMNEAAETRRADIRTKEQAMVKRRVNKRTDDEVRALKA